jgi:amino-acid N-acetyltransferase
MTAHRTPDGRSATLRQATAADHDRVLTLLRQLNLPEAGVPDWLSSFTVSETPADEIVGVAGLEQYGACGLLRSVAVDVRWQGTGLGHALVTEVLRGAASQGLTDLYLLTTTAASYFPRYGFTIVERAAVRPEVQASVEFRSACPASATAMHRPVS